MLGSVIDIIFGWTWSLFGSLFISLPSNRCLQFCTTLKIIYGMHLRLGNFLFLYEGSLNHNLNDHYTSRIQSDITSQPEGINALYLEDFRRVSSSFPLSNTPQRKTSDRFWVAPLHFKARAPTYLLHENYGSGYVDQNTSKRGQLTLNL